MSTATRDALRDYQSAAMRVAEARAAAGAKARTHVERCDAAEVEALAQVRDAVGRLGSDPLRILRSMGRKGSLRGLVLAALPGTSEQVVERTGLDIKQVSNALNKAHRDRLVVTDGAPGRAGVWRRIDTGEIA